MGLRAIFFDAGNTLVFADRSRTLAPLTSRGVKVSQDAIFAAERAARATLAFVERAGHGSAELALRGIAAEVRGHIRSCA